MIRPTAKTFFISTSKPQTLLDCIMHHLPHLNGSRIICSGGVWMNKQRLVNPNQWIPEKSHLKLLVSPTQGYSYHVSDECIIHDNPGWVVVYKEPLVTIGMDRSNQYFNLMAGLNEFYGFKCISSGVQPITRLDYRVGGLALFSKTKAGERYLFRQMQERRIKKRYKIIVDGSGYRNWYRLTNKLSSNYRSYVCNNGKVAKTAFVNVKQTSKCTWFDVSTGTGRRHQIRAHASQLFAPLINDDLYGYPSNDRHSPIGLLAYQIQFQWNKQLISVSLNQHWVSHWESVVLGGRASGNH
jgi:23S rRNA-/tRNA-specific pseudouridylate synthase